MKKAGCVLLNKTMTKVGLVYRKKQGDYSFPKGHIEKNEKLWECAIRETIEETGRDCYLISKNKYTKMEYYTESEGNIIVYMFYAIDSGETDKIIAPEDKEELVWVELNKVNDILTYNNLKLFWLKVLKKLKNL